MSDNKHAGRVVITGASAGIGRELAFQFAKNGHDLILVSRTQSTLDDLRIELEDIHKISALVVPQDLGASNGPQKLVSRLKAMDETIGILVNNAGVLEAGPFVELDTKKAQQMVQLNVLALTTLASLVLPQMVERGQGRILNVASTASFQPIPMLGLYAATKAFVLSLTEALSQELVGTGVTVTALCPGVTKTDMVSNVQEDSQMFAQMPEFFMSDPEDVAARGYKACMAGRVIEVPGFANQVGAAWSQMQPKWLVRNVVGFLSRQTDLSK